MVTVAGGQLLLKKLNPFYEVAVVGSTASTILETLSREYLPHVILVGSAVQETLPLFMDRFERDKTRIFVCQDNVCQQPVENPDDAKGIYHIR